MPHKIIGKSKLGGLGLSQNTLTMGNNYYSQLQKVIVLLPLHNKVICTSMTGHKEVQATHNVYIPKIRLYDPLLGPMFDPLQIYQYCQHGQDPLRPECDFVVWHEQHHVTAFTFSREAPIIAFKSSTGWMALGTILRHSLMQYGDYLFSTINEALCGSITVNLVVCNHFNYPEGSIPSVVKDLATKYNMNFELGINSQKDPECYKRHPDGSQDVGNHVVAMW